jgi:hypothetical protein
MLIITKPGKLTDYKSMPIWVMIPGRIRFGGVFLWATNILPKLYDAGGINYTGIYFQPTE